MTLHFHPAAVVDRVFVSSKIVGFRKDEMQSLIVLVLVRSHL